MFAGLYQLLAEAGLEPTAETIAEVVWLAAVKATPQNAGLRRLMAPEDELPEPDQDGQDFAGNLFNGPPGSQPKTSSEPDESPPRRPAGRAARELFLPTESERSGRTSESGVVRPYHVAGALALPNPLGIARALRPLKKRVPSRISFRMDENKTAHNIAETDLWVPEVRLGTERWLDVALVVDVGRSMAIWSAVASELRMVLASSGAFRDVRLWHLDTSQRTLTLSGEVPSSVHREPRELIDPAGRRVTLVLTDCVGAAWGSGDASRVLHLWGRFGPTAILQPLPSSMWPRAGLSLSRITLLGAHAGQPNRAWRTDIANDGPVASEIDADGLAIPVLEIDAAWLAVWSDIVGNGSSGPVDLTVAIVSSDKATIGSESVEASPPLDDHEQLSARDRVLRFRAVASPTAFRLAGLLSIVPLTLPTMRMVQQILPEGTKASQLAEVFLGGLFRQNTTLDTHSDPEAIRYEFFDGVREILQRTVTFEEIATVRTRISEYLGRRGEPQRTFRALLNDPSGGERTVLDPQDAMGTIRRPQEDGGEARPREDSSKSDEISRDRRGRATKARPRHGLAPSRDRGTVAVLMFRDAPLLESSIPLTVFGVDRRVMGLPYYRLLVCAAEPGPITTTGSVRISTPYGLSGADQAGTVIVPAWRVPGERPPGPALAALRKAHREGARIAAYDSGVFVLAAAGLLDGRKATTHWMYAPALARHHRNVRVDARALVIDGGDVVTGGGAAGGLDLCLHLVRTDHGGDAADSLARRLVIGPGRRSGQAAYFDRHLPGEVSAGTPIGDAMAWALDHLAEPFDVDEFAKHSSMSRSIFDRRFLETTGTTPLRWVNAQRVVVAQRTLESTDLSIDEVARRSGFPSTSAMRANFLRVLGTQPSRYREAYLASRPHNSSRYSS